MTKEIFITIAAGVCDGDDTYEEGFERKITPEQLVEYREIIGLQGVTKILSLYYGMKGEEEPVSPATTQEDS